MRSRLRDLLGAIGLAGALLALVEPRWRLLLLRLASLLAPVVGRRFGLIPRSAFLFAAGRLLDSPESVRSANSPSLIHLLFQATLRGARRAAGRRGRWGLRARGD